MATGPSKRCSGGAEVCAYGLYECSRTRWTRWCDQKVTGVAPATSPSGGELRLQSKQWLRWSGSKGRRGKRRRSSRWVQRRRRGLGGSSEQSRASRRIFGGRSFKTRSGKTPRGSRARVRGRADSRVHGGARRHVEGTRGRRWLRLRRTAATSSARTREGERVEEGERHRRE